MANEMMITPQEAGAAALLALQLVEDFFSFQADQGAADAAVLMSAVRRAAEAVKLGNPLLATAVEGHALRIIRRLDDEENVRQG